MSNIKIRIINNSRLLIIKFFQIFNKIFKSLLILFTPYHNHVGTDLVFLIGKGEHFQALPIVMVELLKADMNPLICYQCQLQAVDVFVKTGFLEDMLLP